MPPARTSSSQDRSRGRANRLQGGQQPDLPSPIEMTHQQQQQQHPYPPLRDPLQSDEFSPLAINSSPDLSQVNVSPSTASQHPTYPSVLQHQMQQGTGVYRTSYEASDSSATAWGDQPYSAHGKAGSLDLADAYGGTIPHPSTYQQGHQPSYSFSEKEHITSPLNPTTSRTPLHQGAAVTLTPEASSTGLREKYKSERAMGGRSPRAHSRDGIKGAGLGNWSGAGGGRSPYGPLGSGGGGGAGNGSPNIGAGNGSGYNSAANSSPNLLVYADGDAPLPPSNKLSRFLDRIFARSFVVRWIIYIIPFLALLWIPGIVGLTAAPQANVWGCPLVWWSAWLSVVWVGWWSSALVARMAPTFLRNTVGVISEDLRQYILYLKAVAFYVGAVGWALANWVSFQPMVRQRVINSNSNSTLALCTQGLFGIFIVLVILLIEKVVIQIIAHNFHKKSYEDRIDVQKAQIRSLVALYLNSRDIGRTDTLDGQLRPGMKKQTSDPALLVKKGFRNLKKVAQTATTAIGTVASEIAGERVLQPNSPESMVVSALSSANKTKQLARRIFFSYAPSYRQNMLLEDIARCFTNREDAEEAFGIFDRDSNGDVSLAELEMSCLEIHRERLALGNSMRDIDSAVGRLDIIIMSLWYVISIIIIAGLLNASFNTMVASAGTLVLGLSWLIGTTAQEILASIIFLFIKHVYDVGDRVDIDGVSYVVKEMHLLSTIFRRVDGTIVQAPHSLLNTKFVNNIRRSGAIQETFNWDVDFGTTFEKIEALRERMLEYVEAESRDFYPKCDITVKDFEGQGKLSLSVEICHKSNWQNGALKAQRRNKYVCALKLAMAELEIWGPAGAGNPAPGLADPTPYTVVPWDEVLAKEKEKASAGKDDKPTKAEVMGSDVHLTSNRGVLDDEANEVFDDDRQAGITKRTL